MQRIDGFRLVSARSSRVSVFKLLRVSTSRPLNAINLLGVLWALSFSLTGTQALAADAATRTVAPESETCKICHAPYVDSYLATKHGQKGNLKGPDCLTCHANGLEHAKAGGGRGVGGIFGFNNKSIPAEKKAAVCLSCHEDNRQLAFWDSGKHKKNDVSCNNCHQLHGTPSGGSDVALKTGGPSISPFVTTVRQLEYETCITCHKDKRAQILKPSHHPIVEGKIKCSDCHNPHGALSPSMIKAEVPNDLCLSCHTDKRGPWIHEHPPVSENCLNCHAPHGSNHNRLLVMKPPELCQECHRTSATSTGGHPGTFISGVPMQNATITGSVTARFMASGCVNCHRQIHGSNAGSSAHGDALVR